ADGRRVRQSLSLVAEERLVTTAAQEFGAFLRVDFSRMSAAFRLLLISQSLGRSTAGRGAVIPKRHFGSPGRSIRLKLKRTPGRAAAQDAKARDEPCSRNKIDRPSALRPTTRSSTCR